MPLTNPRDGTYLDLQKLLKYDATNDIGYDWRTEVRLDSSPIIPNIYQWSEVGPRGLRDPAIVIQVFILRGIELSAGIQAPRTRMGITMHCYSKKPRICEKLADGIWNAFYATDDTNGTRKYVSTAIMTTLKKIIPIGMNDSPPHKEYDPESKSYTGWWVQIVRAEAETQQAN